MRRRIAAVAVIFLCVLGLLAGLGTCVVYAEGESAGNTFSGNVELLRQEDGDYVMQVTAENRGGDFYGTVQVIFVSAYDNGNCAYDTEISLPAQGRNSLPSMWQGGRRIP